MKKTIQLTMFLVFFSGLTLLAQAPPNPPGNAGSGGGPVGGNAPIGSGMVIMLAMGAAYAGWKKYEEVR
jgi:hypothetical protein